MDNFEEVLENIYYDVNKPASFGGKLQLLKAAKEETPKITLKDVEQWLKTQDTYNVFRPRKKKFARLPILFDDIDEQWQADLLDMTWFSRYNDGIKFLLVVIDCMSRYAWVRPLKDKSAKSTREGFASIFSQGIKPKKLPTDQGKEFVNFRLKRRCSENGIHFFTTTDDTIKCAIAERFNRTLRNRIFRYLHCKNSHRYIDDLQTIVTGYNNSYHRAIRMKPVQVSKENLSEVKINLKKPINNNHTIKNRSKKVKV